MPQADAAVVLKAIPLRLHDAGIAPWYYHEALVVQLAAYVRHRSLAFRHSHKPCQLHILVHLLGSSYAIV